MRCFSSTGKCLIVIFPVTGSMADKSMADHRQDVAIRILEPGDPALTGNVDIAFDVGPWQIVMLEVHTLGFQRSCHGVHLVAHGKFTAAAPLVSAAAER